MQIWNGSGQLLFGIGELSWSIHNILSANNVLLLSRYNREGQAISLRASAPPQTAAHQETLQPLPSACPPTNNDVDEIDDDTLINQYDVSGGIGREIFGALGTGGLEDVGEDEDEEFGLADKGKSIIHCSNVAHIY